MTDTGIVLYSPILGKNYELRSDSRIITGLGMVTNNAEWNPLPVPASPNSQIFYNVKDCVSGSSTLVDIELNSNRNAIRFKSRVGTSDPPLYFYGANNPWNTNSNISGSYPTNVYEVGGAQTQGFGLKLASGTNYNEIQDATKAGCLVYKYSGSISHLQELPSTIPNIKNSVVYARWNQDNVSVVLNDTANSKQFGLWIPEFSEVPQPYNGSIQMDILVFSSGILIEPVPSGQVGINVFNEFGQCTFSSYNPPIMLNGSINFNDVAAQKWSALPTTNSMIPLSSSYGTHTIITARSGPGGESWYMLHILDIGISMKNGQYRIFQANHSNGILMPVANPQFHRRFAVLNANIPTIDASFYF